MCVGHGFQRRECFGRDDEKRFGWIETTHGFHEVGPIDIGNESERQVPVAVMSQGFVSHHRSEVGAADSDVDDVANGLAGMTFPRAGPDAV